MKFKLSLLAIMLCFSCRKPMDHYNKTILKNGYIPFNAPISDTEPGSLFMNSIPSDLLFAGMHDECFPDDRLRSKRQVDIPEEYKKISFNSNIDLSPIVNSGNSVLDFTYQSSRVKEVKLEMSGASLESLSLRRFAHYLLNEMDDFCKEDLIGDDFSFILGSMRVESLDFSFKNNSNGEIKLTSDNLDQFASINLSTDWEIINETTLRVTTPKYIGYHMAKLKRAQDGSYLLYVATSNGHNEQKFNYKHRYTIKQRNNNKNSDLLIKIGNDDDLKMYFE